MRYLNLLAVLALLSITSQAQAPAKPADPELIGVIYSLDPASHELKRLPSDTWKTHQAQGFAKVTSQARIEGVASAFRIAGGDKITLVFSAVGEDAMKVHAYSCVVKEARRECDLAKFGRGSTPAPGVPASLAKYGESSYKLTPDQPLNPGEYVVVFNDKVFTFGVDGAAR
jgi:hypothetical protein